MPGRSILFITVHKGASTFIADELGRFLIKSEQYSDFRPVGSQRIGGKEIHEHAEWTETGIVGVRIYPAEMRDLLAESPGFEDFSKNAALVFIQRDPRDAAVSLFYSKAYSHTTNVLNKERFVQDRERLQVMSPLEGVRELTANPAIAEFSKLHQLHEKHGGLMTRYEDLVTNPQAFFRSVGELVGWPADFIDAIFEEFQGSFSPPGAEDPLKHKRRITPGNWIEVFDEDLRKEFNEKIGDRLRANGYH